MRLGAILLVSVGVMLLGGMWLLKAWPLINVIETGKTPEYPDIVPRLYHSSPALVFDAVLHAIHRLPRWELAGSHPDSGEVRAGATSRVFRFVDDVVIRVRPAQDGVEVNVRSASRVGRGDFGQNARNIRTLFKALDQEMQRPHN